jgi:hypothetical protein
MHTSRNVILAAVLLGQSVSAQSQFQNLGFESEALPDIPAGTFGGFVPVTDGLPGWSVLLGANTQTLVYQNAPTFGSAAVAVLTPQWSGIIEGHAMASLRAGQKSRKSLPRSSRCINSAARSHSGRRALPANQSPFSLSVQGLRGLWRIFEWPGIPPLGACH